jgi:hypothetical protein
MTGVDVYLSGLRLSDGELLMIASRRACLTAIDIDGKRGQIEALVSCLKGRGFHLEETRVTDRARIKRLWVVAVVAFCWAHRIGEWQHENVKPIKVKKHQRLANSIFRAGLDLLRDSLLKPIDSLRLVCQFFLQFIDLNESYCNI